MLSSIVVISSDLSLAEQIANGKHDHNHPPRALQNGMEGVVDRHIQKAQHPIPSFAEGLRRNERACTAKRLLVKASVRKTR